MPMSKKHQPVGQRYQIGDRVYRKQANMGAKGSKNYNKRFGTITEVDSSTNAVGAVNYFYMVKWEGSRASSPSKHIQHRLILAEDNKQQDPSQQGFKEVSPGIMFKESKL